MCVVSLPARRRTAFPCVWINPCGLAGQPAGNFTCPDAGSPSPPSSLRCRAPPGFSTWKGERGRALHTPPQIIRTRNEWHSCPTSLLLHNHLPVPLRSSPGPARLAPIGRDPGKPGDDWTRAVGRRCGARPMVAYACMRGTWPCAYSALGCDLVFLSLAWRSRIKLVEKNK